jgi:ribosomal protein L7/L12
MASRNLSKSSPATPQETESRFDVILFAGSADKKIYVIKAVREVTSLSLKEAKDLVEGAPKPIKKGIPKEEAESIKKKFEEVGATVRITRSGLTANIGYAKPVQAATPQTPEAIGPTIEVRDAWGNSFQIAKGLNDLLSIAAESDDGLSPEAAKALNVTSDRLVEEMKVINSFFNQE